MPRKPDHQLKEPSEKHCNGKLRGKNGYCRKTPGHNTWHPGVGRCALHGGAAPTYASEVYRLRADQAVKKYSLPVPIDPKTALIQELERTQGFILFLEFKVNELDDSKNMVGPVGGGQGGYPEFKPSVWYNMLAGERKHLTDVAKDCLKAGIEERRVKLAEQQAQLIADAMTGVLDELVPNWREREDAPQIVRKHLTAISERSQESAALPERVAA